MYRDVVIVGAGPAGLACAKVVAQSGASTLVVERKAVVGPKVCAGGITWNGLINKLQNISEKSFRSQHIHSKKQEFVIREKDPIIATVSRETLGSLMLQQAEDAGAVVLKDSQVISLSDGEITILNRKSHEQKTIRYSTLVGADGSSSVVRKHLGIPVEEFGIGINYMVEGDFQQMEWHLDSALFGSGYAWIFPNTKGASIGAYGDSKSVSAIFLKNSLIAWAKRRSISLQNEQLRAERVNYDFRGCTFGKTYLIGDAAGLASALTGEGIYPGIVSGEAIGKIITSDNADTSELDRLIRNHKKHRGMVKIARTHPTISTVLAELLCFALKKGIIDFRAAEMAH